MKFYCEVCDHWWRTLDGDGITPSSANRICPPCLTRLGRRYTNVLENLTEVIPESVL